MCLSLSFIVLTALLAFKLTLLKENVWMPPLWETLWDVLVSPLCFTVSCSSLLKTVWVVFFPWESLYVLRNVSYVLMCLGGFTHLLLALTSASGFAMSDRNTTASGAASGHHSWVHRAPLPSTGHSCLFCENLLAILVLLQSLLFPGEHLSLWLPDSTSSSWASQSPSRFFQVPKQFHSEWGEMSLCYTWSEES